MRRLNEADIQHIKLGATVLASGGGGDPYIGSVMTLDAMQSHGALNLVGVDELPDDALLATVGMIGAPTVMIEKIPSGEEALQACNALEHHLGRRIGAIYPIEAGGLNSLLPLAAAARMGLPVVDMDGMGRAFPEMQMTTIHLNGINFSPAAVVDEKGSQNLIVARDSVWSERLARAACSRMGGAGVFAGCAISVAQAKKAGIHGILTLEQRIGEAMTEASAHGRDVVEEIRSMLGAHLLFHAKVVQVDRRTEGGWTRGLAQLEGLGKQQGQRFEVLFQNEYLMARSGDRCCCVTPDLISLLDEETGTPLLAERLRYGARVKALGIPCHAHWRTPFGLEVVGPSYFRYDCEYQAVEVLNKEGAQ